MLNELTKKQLEILELICKGYNTQEIATLLNNSYHTINVMRKQMVIRIGAKNMYNLIHVAHKKGWI